MTAPTINPLLTEMTDASSTTGWAGIKLAGAGSAPSVVAETDIFIEGAAAVSTKISGSKDAGQWYNNGAGVDMTVTGRHLYIWVNYLTPGNLVTYAAGSAYGLSIVVSTSGNVATDYIAFSVADSVEKPQGWVRYVIDLNKTPTRSVGSTNLSSVQYFGASVDQTGTVKSENLVVDTISYGTGLQIEDGDATDPCTWEELFADDNAVANQYGIIRKVSGVYYLKGEIQIGDATGTKTTLWEDAGNESVVFENPFYFLGDTRVSCVDAANLYKITCQGNATGTTDISFGQSLGSGDDRQGILGGSIGTDGQNWEFDGETNIADLDTVNLYGVICSGAGTIALSGSTKTDVIGCSFIECAEVQPNDAEFLNNKIIAPREHGIEIVSTSTVKQTDFIAGSTDNSEFDRVWQVDVSTTPDTFVSMTDEAADATTGDLVFFPATEATGDYCAFGGKKRFNTVRVDVGTAGVGGTINWEYWNGSAWTDISEDIGLDDNTSGLTSSRFGNVLLPRPMPEDWTPTSLNNEGPLYYVRVAVVTSFSTNPIGDQALLRRPYATQVHFPAAGSYTAEAWKFFGTGVGSMSDTVNTADSSTVDSYAITNADTLSPLGNGTITAIGQSFTGDGTVLSNARFYLSKSTGATSGSITCKIYAHVGTFGSLGTPTGAALATSNTVDAGDLFTPSSLLIDFEFEDEFTLVNTTKYFVVLEFTGDATNYVEVETDTSTPSHAGNYATFSGTWSSVSSTDAAFFVYSGAIVTINATEGSNPATDLHTGDGPGATIINNSVTLTVNVADEDGNDIQDARVYIEDVNGAQLMNELTTAGGVATETYTYSSDIGIIVRVRKSTTGSTRYIPVEASGTITTDGFTVDITITEDLIASA